MYRTQGNLAHDGFMMSPFYQLGFRD